MKKYFINLLFIIIALLFIFRGMEDIALYVYGGTTEAHITYTEKAFYGRLSGGIYKVNYEFSLPDNSLQTGSSTFSLKGGGEPSGWMNVRYFSFRPDFNKPSGTGIIFYAVLWFIPGIVLILINIRRMRKKSKAYKRLYEQKEHNTGEVHKESPLSSFITLIILLVIGAGLTYLIFIHQALPKENKSAEIVSTVYGNTQGNVNSGGIAVRDGDNIYFANFIDDQKLYGIKADGTGLRKICNNSVSYINFYEGWIYYCNFNDSDKIYKIKPDGSENKRVYKWKTKYLNISGGYFFLSNGNDHNRLYRVKINGSDELKLNNDESSFLSIGAGWLYYANETDFKKLYRIKTNGSQREQMTDFPVSNVVADEKGVYFTSDKNANLYRIDNADPKPIKTSDRKLGMFNIQNQKIYDTEDDGFIYQLTINGTIEKQISKINSWFITILGDKIMFVDFMESDLNYFIDLNSGKTREIVK